MVGIVAILAVAVTAVALAVMLCVALAMRKVLRRASLRRQSSSVSPQPYATVHCSWDEVNLLRFRQRNLVEIQSPQNADAASATESVSPAVPAVSLEGSLQPPLPSDEPEPDNQPLKTFAEAGSA